MKSSVLRLLVAFCALLQSPLASAAPLRQPISINNGPNLGAIASESAECSQIGINIFKQGGNAADATIATKMCVGVNGMYHSGLGGGGFLLVRSKDGEYEFIDFREKAPAAAFEEMFSPPYNDFDDSLYTGLASGVPGELRGLELLHTKYGSMPWKDLVMPSVNLARDGFNVTEDLIRYMDAAGGSYHFLYQDPTWAIDFAPNGTRLGVGETMTRKRYADTLEKVAEHGADAFYKGEIAQATINALANKKGIMSLDDLSNYDVLIREPLNITYRDHKIYTTGAPTSGAAVLAAMRIVEGYDMSSPSNLNLSTHYLDEGMRFAYGLRNGLADPTFFPNVTEYQSIMVSEATASAARAQINDFHTLAEEIYNPKHLQILTDQGTSAQVATDKSGLTVSMTTTINMLFGNRIMVPETGVIMNNNMNDFSIPGYPNKFGLTPTEINFIRPNKRPLSSISPTIVENSDGSVSLAHASAGGSRIITEVIQHLWHSLDQNMTSIEALSQPRFHDQLSPNQVTFELGHERQGVKGYSNETTEYFKEIGANVKFMSTGTTTAVALRRLEDGSFEAAGDPRQYNSGGLVV